MKKYYSQMKQRLKWGHIYDKIRLTNDKKEELKKGEEKAFKLIKRPKRKFEPSIMVAGGIFSKGLTNLILVEGTENEFYYAQALNYYQEDFQKFKRKGIVYFEQDGATPHTKESNKALISELFGKNALLQNPPNNAYILK